jgi:MULE transposase domain
LYREGIQAFSKYSMRGLQVDGTHLKNCFGGVLLVACFRDANNKIRIVSVAIVSGETTANWEWFLNSIEARLAIPPTFIMSDRDKGLIHAVGTVFGDDVHHAACFRHVMMMSYAHAYSVRQTKCHVDTWLKFY